MRVCVFDFAVRYFYLFCAFALIRVDRNTHRPDIFYFYSSDRIYGYSCICYIVRKIFRLDCLRLCVDNLMDHDEAFNQINLTKSCTRVSVKSGSTRSSTVLPIKFYCRVQLSHEFVTCCAGSC